MFILDIKENEHIMQIRKTLMTYIQVTLLTIAVNKIYALFGHGVNSDAMTWMFLYPLIGGIAFYLVIRLLFPFIGRFSGYRIFYNLHNSGIAILTVGSFLKGILDIAGTSSTYVGLYFKAGWAFIGAGLVLLIILASNHKKS